MVSSVIKREKVDPVAGDKLAVCSRDVVVTYTA